MIRILALSALMMAAPVAAGCTLTYDRAEETPTAGTLDRAERARAEADRMHPACRYSRADRDRQPEGCDAVVRRP
tara:strand:+ start:96 stop:320 length:225 start_codon:yes stop_codon:yes gene_type:complete